MNVIIGNAWPYANGSLHLGRIAVLLPGDILARYHRLMGDDVIFISGTDCHGTPVTMKASEEGITPLEVCVKYHNEFKACFKKLGFSFDIFDKTHSEYHEKIVKGFILDLYDKGYIYEKKVEQAYCKSCNEILSDRYIEGNCPYCGGYATGEQCEECSEIFDVHELINRKCKICKETPGVKESRHLFFALSQFENDIRRLIIKQKGWRENAQKIVNRYLKEGLRDKAVTRDFDWGIDVPLEGYEDKKIFVWIEAVMGYITASMKCLEERGEEWKDYWQGEDSRVYFVHGKDNIPFHTVIFPAIMSGLEIENINIRVISSEHLKLEGKNFSSVKNWAVWIDYIADHYNIDTLRYYLALNSPEDNDTDFTWKNFINTNNNDLVGVLGNFVNRTLIFTKKNFNSRIPKGKMPEKFKEDIFDLYFALEEKIEEGKFKTSLEEIFKFIKKVNKYFDEEKPWISVERDKKRCSQTIYVCIQIIANLSNLLEPFIPFTCEKIRGVLGIKNAIWSYIELSEEKIGEFEFLFEKIDKRNINKEIKMLKAQRL